MPHEAAGAAAPGDGPEAVLRAGEVCVEVVGAGEVNDDGSSFICFRRGVPSP